MKTTRYFDEQVLRKRPYIDPAWCLEDRETIHNAFFDRGFSRRSE